MRFRRSPTGPQWVMVGLMGGAFLFMLLWVVPELIGVFSPEAEDTFSEWVWDLPLWGVLVVVVLFVTAGVLMIGSSWHFLEGYGRRRRMEREE